MAVFALRLSRLLIEQTRELNISNLILIHTYQSCTNRVDVFRKFRERVGIGWVGLSETYRWRKRKRGDSGGEGLTRGNDISSFNAMLGARARVGGGARKRQPAT